MKRLYWKPRKVPFTSLLIVSLLTLGAVAATEWHLLEPAPPDYEKKIAAAQLAQRAMNEIRAERVRRGHQFDPEYDLTDSGLIGDYLTPITTVSGHVEAKQTSINPNFAAVVVEMLMQAGVGEGDLVAVGYSGSFPMINICVLSAIETLKARPIIIASAGASQFGANMPDFVWIDMERHLAEKGIFSSRAIAASYGGYEDRAVGMSDEGRQHLSDAIARNDLPLIERSSLPEAVEARMQVYRDHAGDEPIKAYINVGGGTASVGRSVGKKLYQPGLNLEAPPEALGIDSVLTGFMKDGTPVIHMVQITELAEQYGLPHAPTESPVVGDGAVYYRAGSTRWTAAAWLIVIAIALRLTSRRLRKEPESEMSLAA